MFGVRPDGWDDVMPAYSSSEHGESPARPRSNCTHVPVRELGAEAGGRHHTTAPAGDAQSPTLEHVPPGGTEPFVVGADESNASHGASADPSVVQKPGLPADCFIAVRHAEIRGGSTPESRKEATVVWQVVGSGAPASPPPQHGMK